MSVCGLTLLRREPVVLLKLMASLFSTDSLDLFTNSLDIGNGDGMLVMVPVVLGLIFV